MYNDFNIVRIQQLHYSGWCLCDERVRIAFHNCTNKANCNTRRTLHGWSLCSQAEVDRLVSLHPAASQEVQLVLSAEYSPLSALPPTNTQTHIMLSH